MAYYFCQYIFHLQVLLAFGLLMTKQNPTLATNISLPILNIGQITQCSKYRLNTKSISLCSIQVSIKTDK